MDHNTINLSEIWQSQTARQIPTDELLRKTNEVKKSYYVRLILTTLAFSITSAFICWIWINYDPQLYTTKWGIILILLAMAIYGYSLNQQYPLLKKLDDTASITAHLANLVTLKRKQQFLHTTMLNVYFLMLSSGIALYMIEPVQAVTPLWAIVAYTVTGCWIAFSWFYLRPRHIGKQQSKLNEMIGKLENVQTQLNPE